MWQLTGYARLFHTLCPPAPRAFWLPAASVLSLAPQCYASAGLQKTERERGRGEVSIIYQHEFYLIYIFISIFIHVYCISFLYVALSADSFMGAFPIRLHAPPSFALQMANISFKLPAKSRARARGRRVMHTPLSMEHMQIAV